MPIEPVHDGHHDSCEPTEACAYRNKGKSQVESDDAVDLTEQHETKAKHQDAHTQDRLRPKAIHQPPLNRTKQTALNPCQGKRTCNHGTAPAEVLLQQHHVGTIGLHP